MSDETPEIEPEETKRRRRRRRRGKAADASEVTSAPEAVAPSEPSEVPEEPGIAGEDDAEAEVRTEPAVTAEAEESEDAEPEADSEDEAEDEPEADSQDEAEDEPEADSEDEAEDEPEADAAAAPAETRPPAKPAPSRRRARREPGAPIPVVRAQAKYVRSSPRKARLVCDHIRGKSVEEARAILAHTPRAIARDWSKLLESAVANAEHNHELVGEDLYVKAVKADDGPTIKRFRPRAMGRATKIRKRTSHLTILLTPKE
jgi:ribosomal protein L22